MISVQRERGRRKRDGGGREENAKDESTPGLPFVQVRHGDQSPSGTGERERERERERQRECLNVN